MIRENGELRLEPEDARVLALSTKICDFARYGIFTTLRSHGLTSGDERGIEWLTLYQLMLSWRGKTGGSNLRNYLGKYARYVSRKHCYKDTRERRIVPCRGLLLRFPQTSEEFLDYSDLELVEKALKQLEPRTKEILRLRFYKDWTLQEVGNSLGVTRQRVEQIEKRGLEQLRRLLQRNYRDGVVP